MGLNEPGYPSVVAVNTSGGVLTKVGSVGGGSGIIVSGAIFMTVSCISVKGSPTDTKCLSQSRTSDYEQLEAVRW